jgi:NADPH:quinone reductase-like Zn-dependent oxidoreductase
MQAAYVDHFDTENPLHGLAIGTRPMPSVPEGWTRVKVIAASLNHHDLSSLHGGEAMRRRGGAGLTEAELPRILGMDAAGVTEDGREVIVYPVIREPHAFGVLSGRYDGTFAQYVSVPAENLITKPPALSFEQAACLPTAWLTAYRMLFEKAALPPGGSFLVQGASGAVSTALIVLGKSAGFRVWVTGRSESSRSYALRLGADAAFESGARLPERVDAVMDVVGAPTWPHSLKCLRRSGTLVVPGATSGYSATVDIVRLFTNDLRIVGTAMGSYRQLAELAELCESRGLNIPIDRVVPLDELHEALQAMQKGTLRGKAVIRF